MPYLVVFINICYKPAGSCNKYTFQLKFVTCRPIYESCVYLWEFYLAAITKYGFISVHKLKVGCQNETNFAIGA